MHNRIFWQSAFIISVVAGCATQDATTGPVAAREPSLQDSPSWGPDGERIGYTLSSDNRSALMVSGEQVSAEGEDVFPFPAEWLSADRLIYSADGKIRRRDLVTGGAGDIPFEARLSFDRPAYRFKQHDFDYRRRQPVRAMSPSP